LQLFEQYYDKKEGNQANTHKSFGYWCVAKFLKSL